MKEKNEQCLERGQTAIYKGPFTSVNDDENHTFKRGIPLEISADTAERLSKQPYKGFFIITTPDAKGDTSCC